MKRIVVVASLLVATPASATILADWDLADLAVRTDTVVIGVVGSQRSLRVDGLLMTETEVRVERILRGEPRDTLTLSQLGGREGTLIAEVIGTAELIPGERVLLFTYRHADGRRYLVGMALGAFFVRDREVLTRRVDVPLMTRDGSLRPPPGRQQLRLEEVETALRETRP